MSQFINRHLFSLMESVNQVRLWRINFSSKLVLSAFFLGGLAISFFAIVILLPQNASAQASTQLGPSPEWGSSRSPEDRARSYTYYHTLVSRCIPDSMRNTIKTNPIQGEATEPSQSGGAGSNGSDSGEWFDDVSWRSYVYVYPYRKMSCADVMSSAISLWGFSSGQEFLSAMGFSFDKDVPHWEFEYEGPGSIGEERVRRFVATVLSKISDVNSQTTNEVKHFLYLAAFTANNNESTPECKATRLGLYSAQSSTIKSWADNKTENDRLTYVSVRLVDENKRAQDYVYTYTSAATGGVWKGGGGEQEIYTCNDLPKLISDTANDLVEWYLNHPDAPPATGLIDTPGGQDEATTSCAIDGIGWIVCPIVNFLAGIADNAYSFLSTNFLETKVSLLNTDKGNGPTSVYDAWVAMRNIANVLFVIAFMIIIYSQMTGVGISNYGVKKMLPRLIFSAVLVNVSFFICQLAVDLSNILGYSLKGFFDGLVTETGRGFDMSSQATGSGAAGFFGVITAGILAATATYFLFLPILLPVLLAGVVALIMILFILMARQALIVLLVALAPVAFVAFLLPNTQKLFDKWRKTFTALLLVFPIIALVFGVSNLAASVVIETFNPPDGITATEGDETSSWWGQLIGAAIMLLPLFVVPGILKRSLDGVGGIGKMINSRGDALTKSARSKGSDIYGKSRVAGFKEFRQKKSNRRRVLRHAGVGGGPIGKINKAFNQSPLSGEFGDRALAQARSLEEAEDEAREKEDMAVYARMDDADRLFVAENDMRNAVLSGDSKKARVAAKVLMKAGGLGRDKVKGVLRETEGSMSSEVSEGLRSAFNGDSDTALSTFAWKGKDASFSSIEQDSSTYSGKNAEQLAGLSKESLQRGVASGGISNRMVKELLDTSKYSLTDDQRKALEFGSINLSHYTSENLKKLDNDNFSALVEGSNSGSVEQPAKKADNEEEAIYAARIAEHKKRVDDFYQNIKVEYDRRTRPEQPNP